MLRVSTYITWQFIVHYILSTLVKIPDANRKSDWHMLVIKKT